MNPKITCQILKKSKGNQSIKSLFQCLLELRRLPLRMMTLNNISELLRPFKRLPIERWSLNLLGINILKQDSRGSTMLRLMVGGLMISIGVAIGRDGVLL
jgi:hypothetical protein